jgi:hypothetical protein
MAVSDVTPRTSDRSARVDDEHGYGWVLFAGAMLCLLGTLNMIQGIAAISNSHFYAHNVSYVAGNLNAWGWTMTIVGGFQLLVALGVFYKNPFARWTGVLIAGLNAIAQLMFIPSYPLYSLALFTLDILVIYGLVAYGSRIRSTY